LGKLLSMTKPKAFTCSLHRCLIIAGAKAAVIQKRAEAKDYLDIDALINSGVELATMLAAGLAVYGRSFNPMITLKALSYFDDVPTLPQPVRERLLVAVAGVNVTKLPVLQPLRVPEVTEGRST
jgi:hypothetical protein